MNILALDPALRTGFAHTNGERGCWILDGSAGEHRGQRLVRLRAFILDTAKAWGCDRIAFEGASFGSINQATKAFHNELRGIIVMAAAEIGASTVEYKPNTIKKFATGFGHAKKDQMIRACKTMLGIETNDDNVADACFILSLAEQDFKVQQRVPSAVKPKPKRRKEARLFQ